MSDPGNFVGSGCGGGGPLIMLKHVESILLRIQHRVVWSIFLPNYLLFQIFFGSSRLFILSLITYQADLFNFSWHDNLFQDFWIGTVLSELALPKCWIPDIINVWNFWHVLHAGGGARTHICVSRTHMRYMWLILSRWHLLKSMSLCAEIFLETVFKISRRTGNALP